MNKSNILVPKMDSLVKDPYETIANFALRLAYTLDIQKQFQEKSEEEIIELGRIGSNRLIYDVKYKTS